VGAQHEFGARNALVAGMTVALALVGGRDGLNQVLTAVQTFDSQLRAQILGKMCVALLRVKSREMIEQVENVLTSVLKQVNREYKYELLQ
jgi:hypothetical protein